MAERRFLSWPPGWRRALPWGILSASALSATVMVLEGNSRGRGQWFDLVLCFPFIVLFSTVIGARFFAEQEKNEHESKKQ
jgi:hypothetical protein